MIDKIKFEVEFSVHASTQLLYKYISSPSNLAEWFCNDVNSRGEIYTFIWDESEEKARLISKKNEEKVKFRWLSDEEDGNSYFFEIKILEDEITKDISLQITDFSEESEIEQSKKLWENQINSLKQVLGSE